MANTKGIRAGKAYVEVFADNSKLIKGLKNASKNIEQWGKSIRNIGLKLTAVGTALALPLLKASKLFSDMGDNVAKMAKRTGLSVKFVSEMGYVAGQSGFEIETLEKAIRRMQVSLYDAANGSKDAKEALSQLGLSVNDLKNLNPEEQFLEIAKKLSSVKDSSIKAALAMKLFGKSGTELLPMLDDGINGIEQLRKKAQELGLVMSDEDAKAAEVWNDSLDTLTKTLKMGMFRVGAALAPVLTKIADSFAKVAATVNKFIKENPGLVNVIAQLTIGLIGAGLALTTFGAAMQGIGALIGKMGLALKAVGTVVSFILSPFGLIVTAVIAAAGAFLYFSNSIGEAVNWLKGKFWGLYDEFSESISAMGTLLAQGDIAGAAKILWLLIKMEWQKGVNYLTSIWLSFKLATLQVINDLVSGVRLLWQDLQNIIVVGVIEAVSGAKKGWANFFSWYAKTTEWLANKIVKAWMWVLSLFNENIDMNFVDQYLDKDLADRLGNIDEEKAASIKQFENERQALRDSADKDYQDALQQIVGDYDKNKSENDSDFAKRMKESEDELQKARDEWKAAINDVKSKTTESSPNISKPDTSSLSLAFDKIATVGTFSSSALGGLGAGYSSRIAMATEETAKNTRHTKENLFTLLGHFK